MALIDKPVTERKGYKEHPKSDAVTRDLATLAEKHGLLGCVLVQFDRERVGVRSCGINDEFCKAMDTLGVRILTDIDDGRHNPLEHLPTEGRG